MQALYLKDKQLSYLTDYPQPEPGAGQALVRVTLAGICATDLEVIKGYSEFQGVLGHEFVGVVEAARAPEWIGRRVVGDINFGCGRCEACLADRANHCSQRTVLGIVGHDGVFADYALLPLANLHPVADSIPDQMAVFTEPLAAALRIREQAVVPPSVRAAVVGPGRLGLLIGQVLALGGSDVIMLGRRPASLELPAQLGLATGLAEEQADNSFDFVVEVTGNEAGLATALRLIRPLGTLVLKSTFHGLANLDVSKLVVAEINVVGSRCGPFEPALRLLKKGLVSVEPLIDATYPLQDGLAALSHASRPGVRKILLRP